MGTSDSGPVVGLSTSYTPRKGVSCLPAYVKAVRDAGGVPVLLGPTRDLSEIDRLRGRLDGILLIGGPDIDPSAYGAAAHPETKPMDPLRQAWDLALARAVLQWSDMPLLAICLGCQELCVAGGGSLIQHLPDQGSSVEHRAPKEGERPHAVEVLPESMLASIAGAGKLRVNTRHHQGIASVGSGFVVTARAPDGVVEAIEVPEHRFVLGVQWHPERITDWPSQAALFAAFVEACRLTRSVEVADPDTGS